MSVRNRDVLSRALRLRIVRYYHGDQRVSLHCLPARTARLVSVTVVMVTHLMFNAVRRAISRRRPRLCRRVRYVVRHDSTRPRISLHRLDVRLFGDRIPVGTVGHVRGYVSFQNLTIVVTLRVYIRSFAGLNFVFLDRGPY